jgi:hypothetical protein
MHSLFKKTAITSASIALVFAIVVAPALASQSGRHVHSWRGIQHHGGGVRGAGSGYPYGGFGGCNVLRPVYDQQGHYLDDFPASVC